MLGYVACFVSTAFELIVPSMPSWAHLATVDILVYPVFNVAPTEDFFPALARLYFEFLGGGGLLVTHLYFSLRSLDSANTAHLLMRGNASLLGGSLILLFCFHLPWSACL